MRVYKETNSYFCLTILCEVFIVDVTKDELIDAIEEGLETKNPEKLKMLLEQEELNRKKEALRKKEESKK